MWSLFLQGSLKAGCHVGYISQQVGITVSLAWSTDWLHCAGTVSGSSRKQRKTNFATAGANGKLLPGEKARLKRARVDAKRAARSAGQGFNPASVVREIESFVATEGDIKVGLCTIRAHAHLCSCAARCFKLCDAMTCE